MMPYCGIKKTRAVLAGAVLLSLYRFFSGKSELFFSLQHHLLSLWSPLSPSSIVVLFKWVAVDDSFNHCLWPSRERKREKRRLLMIEEKRAICIYHFQITLYDNAVERREKTHTHTNTHTHTQMACMVIDWGPVSFKHSITHWVVRITNPKCVLTVLIFIWK